MNENNPAGGTMRENVLFLIKRLTGQANVLSIPRIFISIFGGIDTALFLSQLLYWQDRTETGWVAKTYREWQEEIALGEYEVRQAVKKLKSLSHDSKPLLETKVKKFAGNPTLHCRLDENVLVNVIFSFLEKLKKRPLRNSRNDPLETQGNNNKVVHRLHTEITTETKNLPKIACNLRDIESESETFACNQKREESPESPPVAKKVRASTAKAYPREWYASCIAAYEGVRGVKLSGDEYAPLQRELKLLFRAGRTSEQIIAFFEWLEENYTKQGLDWTYFTVRKRIADFLAGRMSAGSKSNAEKNIEILSQFLPRGGKVYDSARGSSDFVQGLDGSIPQLETHEGDGSGMG